MCVVGVFLPLLFPGASRLKSHRRKRMMVVCPQNSSCFQELLFVSVHLELPCANDGCWSFTYFMFCRYLLSFRRPTACCRVRVALGYILLCWGALPCHRKEGYPKEAVVPCSRSTPLETWLERACLGNSQAL